MLRKPASRNCRPQPRHCVSRSPVENNGVKQGDLRSPKPKGYLWMQPAQNTGSGWGNPIRAWFSSHSAGRESFKKTSVNIAITSSKVEMRAVLLRVRKRLLRKGLQIEFLHACWGTKLSGVFALIFCHFWGKWTLHQNSLTVCSKTFHKGYENKYYCLQNVIAPLQFPQQSK